MASFEIKRKNGDVYTVLVDDDDLERVLAAGPWSINPRKNGRTPYAQRSVVVDGVRTTEMLHRFIMGGPTGLEVDHINGGGLDNQKSNLRTATRVQNGSNRRRGINNSSGFKGVTRCNDGTRRERWKAVIMVAKKSIGIGRFDSAEEAYEAYLAAARLLHGEFASLG